MIDCNDQVSRSVAIFLTYAFIGLKLSTMLLKRLMLVLMLGCFWQTAPAQRQSSCEREASEKVKQYLEKNPIPGMAIAVSKAGDLIWAAGFGYANLEARTRVSPYDTKFRIGSISKPITAATLAILYDAGKIDLDAEVQEYVATFPEKQHPITVRQVAGHIAGIRHYRGTEFLNQRRYSDVDAGLKIFENDPLLFVPGTKYAYSSYGWNLISAVIEKVSGIAFLDYLQQHVFDRLGMVESTADFHERITPGRTGFYVRSSDGFANAPFVDNSYKWAGGGLLSSAVDLTKFAQGHFDGALMHESTFSEWNTSLKKSDGEETGYGIGWRSNHDAEGDRWVGHSGGSVGGSSMMMCYPERELVVIVLTNLSSAKLGDLPTKIAAIFKKPCD